VPRVLFAPREPPPLSPDVAQDPGAYSAWILRREERRLRRPARGARWGGPTLGLILLAGDAPAAALRVTLDGLRHQTSKAWTLLIVAPESRLPEIERLVGGTRWAVRRRLRTLGVPDRSTGGAQLGQALAGCDEVPVALVHPGDRWVPDAVAALGGATKPDVVLYADEDQGTAAGGFAAPRLKPEYSPDFHLCSGYLGGPVVVGADVARRIPPLTASDAAAAEHEFTLWACELADTVVHVAEVLCHGGTEGPRAPRPGQPYLEEAVRRRDEAAIVVAGAPGAVRVRWPVPGGTTVSILIPFRDEPRLLRTCVDSVTATTRDQLAELVLIDNGSSDPETATLVELLGARPGVRVLRDARPFNWAQLNNAGARVAGGDVLVFLNNDIEAHREGWLAALCGQALRPDVAAAGARLLYPDRRLQHCGLVVGLTGAAGHPLVGLPAEAPGYLNMATVTRECAAVTGACLATRREVFDLLGGFDETLGVDLNDVDYCLRAAAAGYRTLFEPAAELLHHESPSRGTAGGVGDIVNFVDRWREYIASRDPYLNPHLTRADPSCGLAAPEEEETWNQWYATLST
jgi:GT2 family glycosyltransferase